MVELRPRSRRPLSSSGPNISSLFPASFEAGVGRQKEEGSIKKASTLPYYFIAGFVFQLVHRTEAGELAAGWKVSAPAAASRCPGETRTSLAALIVARFNVL